MHTHHIISRHAKFVDYDVKYACQLRNTRRFEAGAPALEVGDRPDLDPERSEVGEGAPRLYW